MPGEKTWLPQRGLEPNQAMLCQAPKQNHSAPSPPSTTTFVSALQLLQTTPLRCFLSFDASFFRFFVFVHKPFDRFCPTSILTSSQKRGQRVDAKTNAQNYVTAVFKVPHKISFGPLPDSSQVVRCV